MWLKQIHTCKQLLNQKPKAIRSIPTQIHLSQPAWPEYFPFPTQQKTNLWRN